MKHIVMWEADDGSVYRRKEDCARHEMRLAGERLANEALQSGRTVSEAIAAYESAGENLYVESRVLAVLAQVKQSTGISIPHWQCRDEPGYRVCMMNCDGTFQVGGDAGSWYGPYGNKVSIQDLARYVERTMAKELP